jgi:hypothetical protein
MAFRDRFAMISHLLDGRGKPIGSADRGDAIPPARVGLEDEHENYCIPGELKTRLLSLTAPTRPRCRGADAPIRHSPSPRLPVWDKVRKLWDASGCKRNGKLPT